MVFQAKVGHVTAQAEQEMVVAVMRRAKQQPCLLHQVAVVFPDFRWRLKGGGAIRCDIQLDRRILSRVERNDFQIFAGKNRGIHQSVERNRAEMNFASGL